MKVILAWAVVSAAAYGQLPQQHRGPPKEAVNACAGKSDGASCSVVLKDKTLSGTCHAPPNGQLACLPAPPAEAVSACAGMQQDAACGFTLDGNNLVGICRAPPGQSQLACVPEHGGPEGMGPPPQR
ncbi:MAG: hypothetical protein QM723_25155 [Myxococcaceae bacterium]